MLNKCDLIRVQSIHKNLEKQQCCESTFSCPSPFFFQRRYKQLRRGDAVEQWEQQRRSDPELSMLRKMRGSPEIKQYCS